MTAAIGAFMFTRTVTGPRTATGASPTALPSSLVFGHGSLALASLAVWGIAWGYGNELIAWIGAAGLIGVIGGGSLLLVKWLGARRAHATGPGSTPYAEEQIPVGVVLAHGVGALATVVLVVAANLAL
ncbi:hypothetical protein [Nocardioides sp. ChNu-153]|uniref:hypothetical protein n=1 Tax=Nocardioides sp. ChNu-153 TaxID=2779364 RepID=UPI00265A2328|nr:hypothetical protein [Nocardioides sp. ChNu-153]